MQPLPQPPDQACQIGALGSEVLLLGEEVVQNVGERRVGGAEAGGEKILQSADDLVGYDGRFWRATPGGSRCNIGLQRSYGAVIQPVTSDEVEARLTTERFDAHRALECRGNALKLQDYAIRIEPLPREEGDGFLVTVPNLPGYLADGETVDAAIAEANDAFKAKAWATAEQQDKGALPNPRIGRLCTMCLAWQRRE